MHPGRANLPSPAYGLADDRPRVRTAAAGHRRLVPRERATPSMHALVVAAAERCQRARRDSQALAERKEELCAGLRATLEEIRADRARRDGARR